MCQVNVEVTGGYRKYNSAILRVAGTSLQKSSITIEIVQILIVSFLKQTTMGF